MRRLTDQPRARLVALLVLALLALGCIFDKAPTGPEAGPPPAGPPAASGPTDAEAISFVNQMNAHRVSVGLTALVWHSGVATVAEGHSQDMVDRQFFSHTNPDGQSPWDRMAEAGITYSAAGENIAYGQSTGTAVLNAWLASAGHRTNIENAAYTHHGVGKVGAYWTHVFIHPSGSAAVVSARQSASSQ